MECQGETLNLLLYWKMFGSTSVVIKALFDRSNLARLLQ